MPTKREQILAGIKAVETEWVMPTPVGKDTVLVVIMHADLAKALADAAKLLIAMIDRAAELSPTLEAMKE